MRQSGFLQRLMPLCLSFALATGAVSGVIAPAPAQAHHSKAALVMDADTGETYYSNQATEVRIPASLTKIMAAAVIFGALESGKLTPHETFTVPYEAAEIKDLQDGAAFTIKLKTGQPVTVDHLLTAMIVASANDAAVALAIQIAGSEKRFVQLMNRKAKELGMKNSYFVNVTGLPDDRQVATAYDMAHAMAHLIKEYPALYEEYFSRTTFGANGNTYHACQGFKESFAGMDGCKSGWLTASGHNLIVSVEDAGHRLIAIIIGEHSRKERNRYMGGLLDTVLYSLQNRNNSHSGSDKQITKPGQGGVPGLSPS